MAQARLTTALTDGVLTLPEGSVCVMRPGAAYDVSALSEAPQIQHTFRPERDWWEAAGHPVIARMDKVATAIVVVPRSKALARGMVAEAARLAHCVVVDGQRTEGVDGLWRELRKKIGDMPVIAKAHGRMFWFDGGDAVADRLADWRLPGPQQGPEGFVTQAGVFSEGAVDRGSRLLLEALPSKLPDRIADFGAGWGFLAHGILAAHPEVGTLDLIEAESRALDCARINVTDPRAAFHWADVTRVDGLWDAIVTNPPFHVGHAADAQIGVAFIAAAARTLTPQGRMWLVANRHLPYEAALKEAFAVVEEAGGDAAFKVFCAARPLRADKTTGKTTGKPARQRSRVRG